MIFVFGSNLRGIHGAGAARHAHIYHQARMGKGEGMAGNSYALPTKWTPSRKMALHQVHLNILNFLRYAATRPDLQFKITQVGCGLGGFTKEQIAPLFVNDNPIPDNCYFDRTWQEFLPIGVNFWGSF